MPLRWENASLRDKMLAFKKLNAVKLHSNLQP